MRKLSQENKVLLILILINMLVRVLYFLTHHVQTGGDSNNYLILAKHISEFSFKSYDGIRTPGFPFFVFLANMNLQVIVIYQMIMGITISVCLFKTMLLLSKNLGLSLLSGLLYPLYLPYLNFEFYILSETTALLFTVLTFLTFLQYLKCENYNRKKYTLAFLTGFFISVTVLTKPHSIITALVFSVVMGLIFLKEVVYEKRGNIRVLIIFFLPILILVGGWVLVMKQSTGRYQLSSLGGIVLFAATDDFMLKKPVELSGNQYSRLIIEDYLLNREEYKNKGKSTQLAVWPTIKDVQTKTNLSVSEISQILGQIGRMNIKNSPVEYLKGVGKNWIQNWKTQGINHENCPNKFLYFVTNYLFRISLILLNVLFLFFPIFVLLFKKIRNYFFGLEYTERVFVFTLYMVTLGIETAMSFVSGSDYGRALVFIEPLIFISVLFNYYKLRDYFRLQIILPFL